MAKRECRVGVVGAGVFGGHHAAKLAEAQALAAVYDVNGARARSLAERHGTRAFAELPAFFEAVDAVVVAAPASRHAALATAALRAGRHVLVEKPIALTVAEADAMIGAARAAHLVLQTGHQERYVAQALGLLDRAAPSLMSSRRLSEPSGRAGDVSAVMDLMIHDLELLASLSRATEPVVTGCRARGRNGLADRVKVELRCGGVEARLSASRMEETATRDLELIYPSGCVRLDFLAREVVDDVPEPRVTGLDGDDAALALEDPLAYGTKAFLDAIADGRARGASGEAGRDALRLACTVEEAVRGELT